MLQRKKGLHALTLTCIRKQNITTGILRLALLLIEVNIKVGEQDGSTLKNVAYQMATIYYRVRAANFMAGLIVLLR